MPRSRKERPHRSPPRSLYRKVSIVLAESAKGEAASLDALIRRIMRSNHLDFTRAVAGDGGPVLVPCSEAAVQRAVDLCQALRLISPQGKIRSEGLQALRPGQLDSVVRRAVSSELERRGWPLSAIDSQASTLLASNGTALPTVDSVVAGIADGASADERQYLRSLIGLLVATGAIRESRKRLLLPSAAGAN